MYVFAIDTINKKSVKHPPLWTDMQLQNILTLLFSSFRTLKHPWWLSSLPMLTRPGEYVPWLERWCLGGPSWQYSTNEELCETGSYCIQRIIAKATSSVVLIMLYIHILSSHSPPIVNQLNFLYPTVLMLMDPGEVSKPCSLYDFMMFVVQTYVFVFLPWKILFWPLFTFIYGLQSSKFLQNISVCVLHFVNDNSFRFLTKNFFVGR